MTKTQIEACENGKKKMNNSFFCCSPHYITIKFARKNISNIKYLSRSAQIG